MARLHLTQQEGWAGLSVPGTAGVGRQASRIQEFRGLVWRIQVYSKGSAWDNCGLVSSEEEGLRVQRQWHSGGGGGSR